jgi:hypothetical protein
VVIQKYNKIMLLVRSDDRDGAAHIGVYEVKEVECAFCFG